MHTLLLRGSGEFDLNAVMSNEVKSGVEHGELLGPLVDATIKREWDKVGEWRERCVATMGAEQTMDALAVTSAFNGITRIADATGIPLDVGPAETTATMRSELGIDDFDYAKKTLRYDSASV